MRIVVDTGVFYRPGALLALDVIVPVVALAERLRQVKRDGFDVGAFRRTLGRAQMEVEPLDETAATRYSLDRAVDAAWRKLSHDAFIAGHVRDDDELWTTNPDDFIALGLRRDQIEAVP